MKRAADHTEGYSVELVTLDYSPFKRIGSIRRAAVSGPVVLLTDTLRRQPPERPALRQHVLPKLGRSACVWIDTGHADDGDGGNGGQG